MSKGEFFNELSECLEGQVSVAEYNDSLSYYRDYFREQEAQGRTEQEILDELGSARLIAHSIIDARGLEHEVTHRKSYYSEDSYDAGYTDDDGESYRRYQETREDLMNDSQPGPLSQIMSQAGKVIVLIVALLGLGLAIRILLPFILVLIVIILFMSLLS